MDNEKILFENKTTWNKSLLLEGSKILANKVAHIKKLRIICSCILIFLIFALSRSLFMEYKLSMILFSFATGMYVAIFLYLFTYLRKSANFSVKNQKYTFKLERTHRIYDDRLEISTSVSKLVIPYHMFNFACETDDAFFLLFETLIVCISKNGFTIGTPNDFSGFIKTKIKSE